ncbi:MAG TPA: glycosyltransferase [Acidobacteriaceae bacterium]|nr:glycosyltransferase [Acidobacteriaceae bacterium]
MRVLLSCLQSTRKHPIAAYDFWETYFKRGIEEAGWEWVEVPGVDWAEPLTHSHDESEAARAWRERTWSRVVDFALREHGARGIDMFLAYLYPRQIETSAVKELQRLGIPCVNFFCDNVREYRRVPEEYCVFDAHWVPEYGALPMYRDAGLRCVHAAMPVWVPPERRRSDHAEQYGPTFIGSRDAQREVLFAKAIRMGAPIRLRGPGWTADRNGMHASPNAASPLARLANQRAVVDRFGAVGLLWKLSYRLHASVPDAVFSSSLDPSVFGDGYADVTQAASVTIGVNRYPSYYHSFWYPGTYSRLRDVEAPMLGACYLTEWTDGLEAMYEPGKEVEMFRSADDLVEKVRQLMADPKRRKSMRREAQRRALSDHAIPRSLRKVASTIGLAHEPS